MVTISPSTAFPLVSKYPQLSGCKFRAMGHLLSLRKWHNLSFSSFFSVSLKFRRVRTCHQGFNCYSSFAASCSSHEESDFIEVGLLEFLLELRILSTSEHVNGHHYHVVCDGLLRLRTAFVPVSRGACIQFSLIIDSLSTTPPLIAGALDLAIQFLHLPKN